MIHTFRVAIRPGFAVVLLALALMATNPPTRTQALPMDWDSWNYWQQQCIVADFTNNGAIDIQDMQAVSAHYGTTRGGPNWDPRFDIEPRSAPDGDIDIKDIQHVFGRFGMTCSTLWNALGGNYAYDSPCADGNGDPIGTILVMPFITYPYNAPQRVYDRLSDIGMASGYNILWTTRDNFRDDGNCVEGAITRATNDGWHFERVGLFWVVIVDSRWHTRCIVHAQPSFYGEWASCTPHWDSPACGKHEVPPVYNGTEDYSGSGFDAARDWMWWQLIRVRGMLDAGPVYFYRDPLGRIQCNGDSTFAESKVNVIVLQ
jgi:hypothetical protein